MKEMEGRLKEVVERERRGRRDKLERKQADNSMEVERGLMKAVVSYFKVIFWHLGGEAEENRQKYQDEALEWKFPNKKLKFFSPKIRLYSIKYLKTESLIRLISRSVI